MFICKTCLGRAFTTLVNRSLRSDNALATWRPVLASIQSRQHRDYATAAAPVEMIKRDIAGDGTKKSRKITPQEWAARKHLQYLKDPLHIADHVRKTLAKGNVEEATLITRKASKNTNVTVSWNHLIDHELQQDKLHAAIKLYNEMKKRAQLPNAQTYTIIFRGCASSSHPKLAVSEAIRIYNTMLANNRLKPNTIHMNAVLQVCAKAEDIDSLFAIADSANEGLRTPNNLTYTTILNALRSTASKRQYGSVTEVDTPEVEKAKAQAIQRAKALWEEVLSKWRAGSINIDEELVCAMGRILLMGKYHDADSVEALLEQTMMISQEDKASGPRKDSEAARTDETDLDMRPAALSIDSFKTRNPGAPAVIYALPGNNSLSMILSASEKTGKTTKSQWYWDIFTKQHGVVPDANNWQQLLTSLRRGRNSFQAASYLREMPAELMVAKNFRTAMSTCLRDNLNRFAFNHATEILQIMMAKLKIPDLMALRTYLRIAYANKRHFVEQSDNLDAGIMAWGKQLAAALDNLWKPFMFVLRQYGNDGPESNAKREMVALARKMIAACDRVIFSNMVPPDVQAQIKPRRNGLNRVVVRHFEQMQEINPNFRPDEELGKDREDEDDFDNFNNQFHKTSKRTEKRPATRSW
ncbi:hypothetical protein F4677DRAFT_417927 [Hypoxylon crocopeplum]|nr:hypothetical protein F4677DRAFT_417927 [Hypoxylon crocopeplum]